jgi:hypothetical protein
LILRSDNNLELNGITINYYDQTFALAKFDKTCSDPDPYDNPGNNSALDQEITHTAEIPLQTFDRHVFEQKYSARICYSITVNRETITVSDVYDFNVSIFPRKF